MTTAQKRKVLVRIQEIQKDISALETARKQVMTTGYASASMSSGGGSKSYTVQDSAKIADAISSLREELAELENMLGAASGRGGAWRQIYTVYS